MGNNSKTKKNVNIMELVKRNKKIIILIVAIIAVLSIFRFLFKSVDKEIDKKNKANISEILEKKQTKIIYVGSSNNKKCAKCRDVIKYLDNQGIKYVKYDVEDYSEEEYRKMLESLSINPDDFGYPGVIYIREGRLYSNVINITDTSSVETFIKDYELKNVK